METEPRAGGSDRLAALSVLVTGVSNDPAGVALTFALVDTLAGTRPVAPDFLGDDLDRAAAFAEEHRVRSITNRLFPGVGGDPIPALLSAVSLERRLIESVGVLEDAGVSVLVLKGSATAHLDYAQATDREVGDVDVLVKPAQLPLAASALEAAGYRRKVTHPFRTLDFFHSETFEHADGSELDVHIRLAQPSRTPVSCWESPEPFVVGGRQLAAMPTEWRFLHALVHQVMNPPPSFRGVNGLLDLVLLAPHVEMAAVRRAADEIGLREIAERGLARLSDLVDVQAPAVPRPAPGRAERRYAEVVDSNRPTPGYLSLTANLAVHPLRRWPRYVTELLWPSKAYRRELGVSPLRQLRHVAREAVGR